MKQLSIKIKKNINSLAQTGQFIQFEKKQKFLQKSLYHILEIAKIIMYQKHHQTNYICQICGFNKGENLCVQFYDRLVHQLIDVITMQQISQWMKKMSAVYSK